MLDVVAELVGGEAVGVLAGGEVGVGGGGAVLVGGVDDFLGVGLACWVAVVEGGDAVGSVLLELLVVLGGVGDAAGGDGVGEAVAVGGDDVEVAFDDVGVAGFSDVGSGVVYAV